MACVDCRVLASVRQCRVLCNYRVGVIKCDIGQMGPQAVRQCSNSSSHRTHTHSFSAPNAIIMVATRFEYFVSQFGVWKNANRNGNRMFSLPLRRMIDKSFYYYFFFGEQKQTSFFCAPSSKIGSQKDGTEANTSGKQRNILTYKIHENRRHSHSHFLTRRNRKRIGKLHQMPSHTHKKKRNERK